MIAEVVLSLVLDGANEAGIPWYEHYQRGVELVERRQGVDARVELEKALRLRGKEGLQVRTDGPRYVDYLPHLYLAISSYQAGDTAKAREHLAVAQASGVAARSVVGRPLLDRYQDLLKESKSQTPAGKASFDDYPRRPALLSEGDFKQLQSDVLSRCHLRTDARTAPWYFHYELGLELARRGDNQRALDALIEAATQRGDPQQVARIYGVWFIDYLPYFNIARAHSLLGNWDCAANALAMSERTREISPKDRKYEELRALAKEIKEHADKR